MEVRHKIGCDHQRRRQQYRQTGGNAPGLAALPIQGDALILVLLILPDHFRLVDLRGLMAQQLIHRDTEQLRQLWQQRNIRAGLIVFPFSDRLGGHAHLLRQPVLGPSQPLPVLHDPFSQCLFHRNSSLVLMAQLCHKSPKKAITYPLIGRLFLSSVG